MSALRIGLCVGAAVLLALIWWRVQLSFTQGAELDEQRAHIDALTIAAARDQRIADEIATFRGQQFDFAKAFRDAVASSPLTRKVPPHVDPTTGIAAPCIERDPAIYRELWHKAITGALGVP